ncbi:MULTISPECIES: LysR family transcriptional regulator [unclassified Paenibacillus]|uniref:LysR family transcriptional regulator n=1 Tax=unclassified Paenibacillus TaxID=185978 RepID=UPI0027D90DFF|nr:MULTISPECIES: LysR family transcriptional regulator [unclassified Paenibacillus]
MESSDLRIFRIVAQEQSISKAALKMGYVQSNVTLRIQKLEKELGQSLFDRSNKGITITEAGQQLWSYADQIVDLLDEATRVLKVKLPSYQLQLGATPTVAASRLPQWLLAYYEENRDVDVSIQTHGQIELMNQVVNHKLDGAFISSQYHHQDIQSVFEYNEQLVIVSADHIHTESELLQQRLIVNTFPDCPYRKCLEEWYHTKSKSHSLQQLPRVIEVDTVEAIIRGVTDGLGISLLPERIVRSYPQLHSHTLPIPLQQARIQFVVSKQTPLSITLSAFINLLIHSEH